VRVRPRAFQVRPGYSSTGPFPHAYVISTLPTKTMSFGDQLWEISLFDSTPIVFSGRQSRDDQWHLRKPLFAFLAPYIWLQSFQYLMRKWKAVYRVYPAIIGATVSASLLWTCLDWLLDWSNGSIPIHSRAVVCAVILFRVSLAMVGPWDMSAITWFVRTRTCVVRITAPSVIMALGSLLLVS